MRSLQVEGPSPAGAGPHQKFRTFEEAEQALWLPPGDPRIFPRLRRLAELASPSGARRGVARFRTIEQAKAAKWGSALGAAETS